MFETIPDQDRKLYMFALRIVGDFGITIAVPVVILSWLGTYFDEQYGTKPWLLVVGFVISALFSGGIVYSKAKKYNAEYQKLLSK